MTVTVRVNLVEDLLQALLTRLKVGVEGSHESLERLGGRQLSAVPRAVALARVAFFERYV